ncbi:nuclear nucleic acid-binding protein C1D [Cynara cardunculus var. scolymus]|uniref:Nuclear nucleic acid-binding protein C1D n=1 Tax=Cynara cardunculus var. scolymus TaxID=59895 RepID=A0A103XIH6_CYNCS|nr:nuclear nucleic acid-binding protein C1D [Cynara cardunculus var. scolymus]KVH91416.1 Exosome-associated factor Rrp47/DNA strand repair C1D [Cynara cardunculus var. scolymus]
MEDGGVVPESVTEAVNRTSTNFEEFRTHFVDFLPLCEPNTLSELDPLQRAQALLLLAKATTTLFTLKLRCNGVDPDDHPLRSELERLNLYQEKLDRCINLSNAPLRPSTTLNYQAATRFIEHSLPELTPEQRKNMREISRREGVNRGNSEGNVNKRRKYLSSDKTSVKTAAQEFLEKAARELLGDDKSSFKGPLKPQDTDEDDMSLS